MEVVNIYRTHKSTEEQPWGSGYLHIFAVLTKSNWAASSEFVFSSIPSWQILTAHAQPFRGARDLAFCLKVPLDSLLVWASRGGSGKTTQMRRLAWTFAARIGHKYQIRLMRPNWSGPLLLLCSVFSCVNWDLGCYLAVNLSTHELQEGQEIVKGRHWELK